MTENETAGWHHRLDGYECEQAPGVRDGQGGLLCYGAWGRRESDTTELTEATKREGDDSTRRLTQD